MRTLALLLLLINIAFFAWQQQLLTWLPWQPAEFFPPPAAPSYPSLPQLVLLSEREAATQGHSPTSETGVVASVIPEKSKEISTASAHSVSSELGQPTHSSLTQSVVPLFTPVAAVSESPAMDSVRSPHSETSPPTAALNDAPNVPVSPVTPNVTHEPSSMQEKAATIAEDPTFKSLAIALISEGKIASQPLPTPTATMTAEIAPTPDAVTTESGKDTQMQAPTASQITTAKTSDNNDISVREAAQLPDIKNNHESVSEQVTPTTPPATSKTQTLLSVPTTKTNKTEVVCYRISGFSQLGTANSAANWFKQKRVPTTTQKSDTRLATTTWVYLPPARSLQLAQATQQQLKRLGIKDTDIISNASGNTVSLGVYRDKSGVAQRLNELQAKGFRDVKTEKRYATETKYWLSVKIATDPQALLSKFQKVFKGLQATTVACNVSP